MRILLVNPKHVGRGQILRIHVQRYTQDRALIERIASDHTLINTIIDGKKPGQLSATEIIRSYLG